MRRSNAVFGRHDEVWFPARGQIRHGDVVEAFEAGARSIDLDNDLVTHLDEFWGCADGGTWDDAAVFCDGAGFDDGDVKFVVGFV